MAAARIDIGGDSASVPCLQESRQAHRRRAAESAFVFHFSQVFLQTPKAWALREASPFCRYHRIAVGNGFDMALSPIKLVEGSATRNSFSNSRLWRD